MGNFNRDNRSGGGKNFGGGGRGFGGLPARAGRDSGRPQQMHPATCSDCGEACEVPFRPTGEKPVYCQACFANHREENPRSSMSPRAGGSNFSRPSFGDKPMFDAICSKCGNKCAVPFRPSGNKPVYCSQCFEKGVGGRDKGSSQTKEQLDAINSKLDKILKILNPSFVAEKPQAKKAEEKVSVEKKPVSEKQPKEKKVVAKAKKADKKKKK